MGQDLVMLHICGVAFCLTLQNQTCFVQVPVGMGPDLVMLEFTANDMALAGLDCTPNIDARWGDISLAERVI